MGGDRVARPGDRHLDLVGAGLATGGLFALVWALIQTGTHAWGSAYTLGFLAAAAVLLGLFIAWERRSADPMLPLGFFRRQAFSASAAVVLLVGFSLFGAIYFVTLYFQNVKGYSPLQAGIRSLPMTVMITLLSPLAGRLNAKMGTRAQMSIGMLLVSGGMFGLSHIQVASSYNAIWPFYVLVGAGMALTMPAVSATGMAAVDRDRSGIASGVINATARLAVRSASPCWARSRPRSPATRGPRDSRSFRRRRERRQSPSLDSFWAGKVGPLPRSPVRRPRPQRWSPSCTAWAARC